MKEIGGYRTVIEVEVLSEKPLEEFDAFDPERLGYMICERDCSGKIICTHGSQELNGKQMAEALIEQDFDPEFFGLDAQGNALEEH
jgi:hypothetical protein